MTNELIPWSDRYSVGIEEIDQQHQKLIGLINRLHEAKITEQGNEVLWEILVDLVDYVRIHFVAEEKIMEERKFPKAKDHKLAHYDLMKKVLEFNAGFWSPETKFSDEVLTFLKDWLVNHIIAEDMQYAFFLKTRK